MARWSPLRDAIQHVDALGFNAIDFSGLDFWPVHDRFRAGDDDSVLLRAACERDHRFNDAVACWSGSREGHDVTISV